MTSPQDLDQVTNTKLDKIARLQHVHGKRLDDLRDGNLRLPFRLNQIEKAADRVNARLDLIEDAQNTHGAKLDEIMKLLRKEQ